ncbi:MAG: tetratricopeptide repeat protein [Alphaproteobacteria bacterium]|nr:tetratricopeptide repeat protein [Alphaproteobacteria bacterium]
MSDIFREVDEDLRSEHYEKLWKKYGRFLIGAAVSVVVVTAAWQGWTAWQRGKNERNGERFMAAVQLVQRGQPGAAITLLEALEGEAGGGYVTLSRLQRAAALVAVGDRRAAMNIYDQVAADTGIDKSLRDLAALLAAQALIDTADRATIERRTARLNLEENPYRFAARELLALAAMKANDTEAAKALLTALADDPATPQGARARATEMLAAIGA